MGSSPVIWLWIAGTVIGQLLTLLPQNAFTRVLLNVFHGVFGSLQVMASGSVSGSGVLVPPAPSAPPPPIDAPARPTIIPPPPSSPPDPPKAS